MSGLLLLTLCVFLLWGQSVIRDDAVREHLALRRHQGATFLQWGGELERAGEHVRDLTLIGRGIRWQSSKLWIIPGSLVVAGLVATLLGAPPWLAALAAGLLLALYGAFDEVSMPLLGHESMAEDRTPGEWPWFFAGLTTKVGLAIGGLWGLYAALVVANHGATVVSAIGIVVSILVLNNAHLPSAAMLRRARALRTGDFAARTGADAVLLLRSFSDDDLRIRSMLAAGGADSPLFPARRMRFEEHLSRILAGQGRLVAIGRPGERLPELGAVRTYWPDDQWQDAVRLTATRCKAVVLIAGASDGLEWELQHLREWNLLGKTLVVLPPDPDLRRSTARFRAVSAALQPGRETTPLFDPRAWLGLRFRQTGYTLHYLADGRDWFNYAVLITVFFNELMGHDHVIRHGAMRENLDRLEEIVETATTPAEAMRQYRENPVELGTGAEPTMVYASHKVEWLGVGRLIRLGRLLSRWVDASDISPSEAIPILEEMVTITTTPRSPGAAALFRTWLADALIEAGDTARAGQMVTEGLALAERMTKRVLVPPINMTPPEVFMELHGTQADLCARSGDRQGQVDALTRVLASSRMVAAADRELETLAKLGQVLLSVGRTAEARPHLDAAIALADSLGDSAQRIDLHWKLARTDQAEGDIDSAIAHMDAAAAYSKHHGALDNVPQCHGRAAEILFGAGRTSEALARLDLAIHSAPAESVAEVADAAHRTVVAHVRPLWRSTEDRDAAQRWLTAEDWLADHRHPRWEPHNQAVLRVVELIAESDSEGALALLEATATRIQSRLLDRPDDLDEQDRLVQVALWASHLEQDRDRAAAIVWARTLATAAGEAQRGRATSGRAVRLVQGLGRVAWLLRGRPEEEAASLDLLDTADEVVAADPTVWPDIKSMVEFAHRSLFLIDPTGAGREHGREYLRLRRERVLEHNIPHERLLWAFALQECARHWAVSAPHEALALVQGGLEVVHGLAAGGTQGAALAQQDFEDADMAHDDLAVLGTGILGGLGAPTALEWAAAGLARLDERPDDRGLMALLRARAVPDGHRLEAARWAAEAVAAFRAADAAALRWGAARCNLVEALCLLASIVAVADRPGALRLSQEAVELSDAWWSAEPMSTTAQRIHATAQTNAAGWELPDDPESAVARLREAHALSGALLAHKPQGLRASALHGIIGLNLVKALDAVGGPRPADLAEASVRHLRRVAAALPGHLAAQLDLAWGLRCLGTPDSVREAEELEAIARAVGATRARWA